MRKKLFTLCSLILLMSMSCSNKGSKEVFEKNEAGEKLLKVAYYNYRTNEDVDKFCTEEEAAEYLKKLLLPDDSFLTIIFSETQAIQFVVAENGKILAEITNDGDERIYMQRYAASGDCIEMIKTAYTGDPNKLEGFVPVPIMKKTLDEVLNEKN